MGKSVKQILITNSFTFFLQFKALFLLFVYVGVIYEKSENFFTIARP